MTDHPRILVIGDIVMDILPDSFPLEKNKILIDGETFINKVHFQRGGCAGNFSVVLKNYSPKTEVEFISRIGDDDTGRFLIKEMEKSKVIPRFIIAPKTQTQVTIAVSFKDGERHFLTSLGGLKDFGPEHIEIKSFEGIQHLAYRGPWFAEKLLFGAKDFLSIAKKKYNITTSMDLGFDPFWNLRPNQEFNQEQLNNKIEARTNAILNALPYVDYLFGNEQELIQLTKSNDLKKAIKNLAKFGLKNLILHRGSKGARLYLNNEKDKNNSLTNDNEYSIKNARENGGENDNGIKRIFKEIHDIPPLPIKVINPVGSGDTFDAIFIAEIVKGQDPKEAAKLAAAGAAYSLQNAPGTPITEEVIKDILR